MTEFIIHGVPGSPYTRSTLIMLNEKGARFRFKALAPGSGRSAEHLTRMPFGRIPVMEHGDFILYETQAILRYLERLYPEPALIPTDVQAAARMDQLVGVNDWYVFGEVAKVIVFHRIVSPRLLGGVPDEAAIAAAVPKAEVCYGELDRVLSANPYMTGADVTLADLMLGPQLAMMSDTPEGATLMSAYPRLSAWLARLEARPSFEATTWEAVAALARAA